MRIPEKSRPLSNTSNTNSTSTNAVEKTAEKTTTPAGKPKGNAAEIDVTSAQNGLANIVANANPSTANSPLYGSGSLALPGEAQVKNKSLQKTLNRAFRLSTKHFPKSGQSRRPDNAYPQILAGREAVWDVVDSLIHSHVGRESSSFKDAMADLKNFTQDFRDVGDEANMPRVWNGYSAERPGLKTLLQNVFDAAGMAKVSD